MKRLAKILLDSSRAPERFGPKTSKPASRSRSPTPAASAVSGPTTTRSTAFAFARSRIARMSVAATSGKFVPRIAVPALPGAWKSASHDGDCASCQESASSRAPPPTIRIRTELLPFYGSRRFGGDIVGDAVDPRDLVDDARRDSLEQRV